MEKAATLIAYIKSDATIEKRLAVYCEAGKQLFGDFRQMAVDRLTQCDNIVTLAKELGLASSPRSRPNARIRLYRVLL